MLPARCPLERSCRLFLGALVSLLFQLGLAAPASSDWELPATAISAAGRDANDPQVAVDRKGNALVVWQRSDGTNARMEAAFRPRDGSFAAAEPISAAGEDAAFPQVAFDKKGNALAVWQRSDGTNSRIEAAFRPRNGTFAAAEPISAAGEDAAFAQVAFDKKGNALAVWQRFDGTNLRVEAASRPRDGSFAVAEMISPAGVDASQPQVAVHKKGTAMVVWQQFDGVTFNIGGALRPAGTDFQDPSYFTPDSPDAGAPRVAFSERADPRKNYGVPVAVWRRSDGTNDRIEFGLGILPSDLSYGDVISAAGQDADTPRVAMDARGNALGLWERSDGTNTRIEAAYRRVVGQTAFSFAAPAIISAAGADAHAPEIAFDKKGNALALWERFDGANFRIEAALRPLEGSFAAADMISAGGRDADSPRVAVDKKGNALAVWRRSDGTNVRIEAAFRAAD
jgi:hypothetical protein